MAPVDLVADAAWFAQMPGNWQWRPRDAKLSSRAFAALASGHNFARGKRDGNPWGEALALLRTPSGQPFYLNLHSSPEGEDSADKKLPGNTLIIGSTGVGKTTLEMFLLTLTRKWDPAPRLVLFDLDRGCEIAIRALGGRYFTLRGRQAHRLQPAAARADAGAHPVLGAADPHLHRDAGAAAAAGRRTRDRRRGEGGGDDAGGAAALLDGAAEPAEDRREQPVRAARPLVPGRRARLGLRPGRRPAAATCTQPPSIGFDTTEFLDLPEVRTPVMLYLLQVMEELVNGERLIYVISEFWKALDHEIFSDFAKQKQKTIRKQNGLGIFDTQSPSDVLRHPIGRTMVEQSVTKIFLANPEAVREEYVDGFGLSEAEFDIVRSLGAQGGRRFLVKQGHASAICELDLAGLDDFVTVLSATTDNVALLDDVRERHGDDPFQWLPVLLREVQDRRSQNFQESRMKARSSCSRIAAHALAFATRFGRAVRQGQRGRQACCRTASKQVETPPLPAGALLAQPCPAAERRLPRRRLAHGRDSRRA